MNLSGLVSFGTSKQEFRSAGTIQLGKEVCMKVINLSAKDFNFALLLVIAALVLFLELSGEKKPAQPPLREAIQLNFRKTEIGLMANVGQYQLCLKGLERWEQRAKKRQHPVPGSRWVLPDAPSWDLEVLAWAQREEQLRDDGELTRLPIKDRASGKSYLFLTRNIERGRLQIVLVANGLTAELEKNPGLQAEIEEILSSAKLSSPDDPPDDQEEGLPSGQSTASISWSAT